MLARENMSSVKFAFGYCLVFAIVLSEVTSWTIDLKEVRRNHFEKVKDVTQDNRENREDNYYGNVDGYLNDKKHDFNGKHNSKYADNYEYQSYMEKKIQGIVHYGSAYLDGLRRSIERYSEMLENCTRYNSTMNRSSSIFNSTFQMEFPFSLNMTDMQNMTNFMQNSTNFMGNSTNSMQNSTNFMESIRNFIGNMTRGNMTSCRTVSQASEYVRRLAELATHTTKKLQDIAYAKKYEYYKDYTMEENELILKLAWFLDRLAYITGYEPEPREFMPNITTSTPVPVMSLMNAPDDVKNAMMRCMEGESPVPATERCRYPLPMPPLVRQIFNLPPEDTPSSQLSQSSSDIREVVSSNRDYNSDQSSLELLIATDDRPSLFYPHSQHSKTIRIRAIDDRLNNDGPLPLYTKIDLSNYPPISSVKSVRKRSIEENPLTKFMNYYIKHKVWINSNSLLNDLDKIESLNDLVIKITNKKIPDEFHVSNDLAVRSVQKRSIDDNPMLKVMKYYAKNKDWDSSNPIKNSLQDSQPEGNSNIEYEVKNDLTFTKSVQKRSLNKKSAHFRIPENPTQDISEYVKHKPGISYIKDKLQAEKIIEILKKMRNKTLTLKNYVQKSEKNRQKRSLHYENMYLPRQSENPTKDLSYYVKNREGTDYDSNLIQAALVRANLQQIFETGNIEVARRYGSNYNPLNPAVFMSGVLKAASDI